jgi:hypothetical protein
MNRSLDANTRWPAVDPEAPSAVLISSPRSRRSGAGSELPRFIEDAFREGGILAHGFLRLRCGQCGHDKLLAFSCGVQSPLRLIWEAGLVLVATRLGLGALVITMLASVALQLDNLSLRVLGFLMSP